MANSEHDAIIIGGGHNGLVSAAYFARSGARTLVLERRNKVGGAADTSSPFADHPSIKVSTYSYVMAVMPSFIIRDLELERYGYRIAQVDLSGHPMPDGGALETWHEDPERTHESMARFSKRDADIYPEWQAWLEEAGKVVSPLLMQVPPRLGSFTPGDLLDQARLAWKVRKLGMHGVADLTRLFTMSVTDLIDRWFESDQVKGAIAEGGVIGTWAGPDEPGTAYVLLHTAMADVDGGDLDKWGYPHGGMGAVANAIRLSAEAAGCEVRNDAPVAKILTRGGEVQGVVLESGEELRAPIVVSAIHPKIGFLELLEAKELPGEFVRDIEDWRTRSGVVKINLAISELPDFRYHPGTHLQEHHRGSLNLCFSRSYIERAFQDAHLEKRGAIAPFVEGTIPSSMDPELAPEGVHVFSMFSQWVPHEWSRAPHRDELEAYADRIVDLYTDLAPNFRRSIIDRQVLGPYDMEQELGLIGGNIYHGELSVDQLFHMRPALGFADFRTPIRGLYHASSATHGGGGVNGIPGVQAFRQAKRDGALRAARRRSRAWMTST
jgi:phytoene dehydrogenase-like protein